MVIFSAGGDIMLPHVTVYNIISLDGRIDWTQYVPEAVDSYYRRCFFWKADAILAGGNTVFLLGGHEDEASAVDLPRPEKKPPSAETENLVYEPLPLLVVPDSRGRIHNWRMMDAEPWWREIVVLCSRSTPESYLEYLEKRHVGWIVAGEDRVDLRAALEELNARFGVRTVWTDCGGSLNGALLRAGLVDEVSVLIQPCMAGGRTSPTLMDGPDVMSADDLVKLRLDHVETLEDGLLWLRYGVEGKDA